MATTLSGLWTELSEVEARLGAGVAGVSLAMTDASDEGYLLLLPVGGRQAPSESPLKQVCRASLEEIEREYLRTVLTRGNISRAAERAGITRRTLYNKLEAYGMRREDFVPSG